MQHTTIVIVHYNSDELTTKCLQSLQKLDGIGQTIRVIVVDNGSTESFHLQKKFTSFASLLRSESNLGFTGGNNLGIHHAIEEFNSDYIVLLNNDTLVDQNFLKQMIVSAESDQECGMVVPKIYFAEGREYHHDSYLPSQRGSVLWFAGGSIDWANLTAFHRGVDEVDRDHFSSNTFQDFATGCCVLLKREVLEKIGVLDDRYFLYFEDVDLSMKVKLFGYHILFCEEAKVWHVNAGSSDGAGSLVHQYYQNRNRLLFFWEYGSWRVKVTVIRLLLRFLLSDNKMEQRAALHFVTGQLGKQPIV